MIDRRDVLAGAVAASGLLPADSSMAIAAAAPSAAPIDPRDYGVRFDGLSDDTQAWRIVLSLAAAQRRPILCPPGVSCIRDTITLPENVVLLGAGAEATTIHIANSAAVPSLYGIACTSGVRIADLGLRIENVPKPSSIRARWAAGIGFVSTASAIRLERVAFRGAGAEQTGQFGGYLAADVNDVRFIDCHYEGLEIAGVVKGNLDRSAQREWQWSGCRGTRCVDGISINSPAGEWSAGRIIDCDFSGCAQFPFSLAGPRCSDWVLDVSGRDNDYELVHIEDGAHRIVVRLRGEGCNRQIGVRGSPASPNGLIQIIGGAHAITVDVDADLTLAGRGAPNALVAQHGGPRLSDGLIQPPQDITIRGRLVVQPGRRAIVANDVSLRFDDLVLVNRPGRQGKGGMMILSGCRWAGALTIHDPGDLIEADPNSAPVGMWDRLHLSYSGEPEPFRWIIGAFPEPRNAFAIARSLRIEGRWTDRAEGWVGLVEAPYTLDGDVAIKRTGAIQSYALGRLTVRAGAVTGLSGTSIVARAGEDASPPGAEWRIVSGLLQCRVRPTTSTAWRRGAPDPRFLATIDGPYFPTIGTNPDA